MIRSMATTSYVHSNWDRLRKSKAAAATVTWVVLCALVIVIAAAASATLTYIGLQTYKLCVTEQVAQLDAMLSSQQACTTCEALVSSENTFVCQNCHGMANYTALTGYTTETAELQSSQAIHESLGWLWNWCNITWPTRLLTRWVLLLNRYGFLWSYYTTAAWTAYCLYTLAYCWTRFGMSRLKTALSVADQTPPPNFELRPSVVDVANDALEQRLPYSPTPMFPSDQTSPRAYPMGVRQRLLLRQV
jgi:hypothetical protein